MLLNDTKNFPIAKNVRRVSGIFSSYTKVLLFFYHMTQTISGWLINFRIAMLPCYWGFSLSVRVLMKQIPFLHISFKWAWKCIAELIILMIIKVQELQALEATLTLQSFNIVPISQYLNLLRSQWLNLTISYYLTTPIPILQSSDCHNDRNDNPLEVSDSDSSI